MDDRFEQHRLRRDAAQKARPADSRALHAPEHDGLVAAHAAEPNRLLHAASIEDYAALLPHFESVRLPVRKDLIEPDTAIRDVHFLRSGVASVIAEQEDHLPVEVGTIGVEGFVGMPILLGAESMPYRVFVQVEGDGWRMRASRFRQSVDESPALRKLLLRYAQYWTSQLSQSVACNGMHTLDERCARWLLMTQDRVRSDVFDLTHEFLAFMLGVRRAGVTVAMGNLQEEKILSYARGRIRILDRAGLEKASCACYRITQAQYDQLLGPETP